MKKLKNNPKLYDPPTTVTGPNGDMPFKEFMAANPDAVDVTLVLPFDDKGVNNLVIYVLKYDLHYTMRAATKDQARITFFCKNRDDALLFRLSI